MKPDIITFTGFDNYTSIEEMEALSKLYPIEWGILFSPTRQGLDHRYPSISAIRRLILRGGARQLRLAAHLCGDYSRQIMGGSMLSDRLPVSLDHFARVQVNHPEPICERADNFACHWRNSRVILQSKTQTWLPRWASFDVLFDASGGRGVEPAAWPPYPGYYVGYAGGISPDNVRATVAAIDAKNAYWIDMESGVRTDDVFDLGKCRAVCEAVFGAAA